MLLKWVTLFRVKTILFVKLETLIVNRIYFDEELIITKPKELSMLRKFLFFNENVLKVKVKKVLLVQGLDH
jgi:hypothetical protein